MHIQRIFCRIGLSLHSRRFQRTFIISFPKREIVTKTMNAVKSMRMLGYAFNTEGRLCKINEDGLPGNEAFQFNVSNDHQECQAHYEELGSVVTDYVYHILETETKLIKKPVPINSKDATFIFVSEDYDKKDDLVILIHGSGAVRAGQWARSLIINENLDKGTQIPYIKKALHNNYGIIILNTNDNCLPNGKEIPESASAEKHALYVWKNYVANTKALNIAIIAHSYGGIVTFVLADKFQTEFKSRVKAIALTDSVHGYSDVKIDHVKKISRNWISSSAPLDTPMKAPEYDIYSVSAGHQKHEMTSYCCIESVFKFINEKCLGK